MANLVPRPFSLAGNEVATWRLHTELYKLGWHTPTNNAPMKNSKDLIFSLLAAGFSSKGHQGERLVIANANV